MAWLSNNWIWVLLGVGFIAMHLFGYTTKKDLTGFGSFLMIGLVGLVLASLVRMFWNPPGFSFRSARSACSSSPGSSPMTPSV